jgi:hypothetical protein
MICFFSPENDHYDVSDEPYRFIVSFFVVA